MNFTTYFNENQGLSTTPRWTVMFPDSKGNYKYVKDKKWLEYFAQLFETGDVDYYSEIDGYLTDKPSKNVQWNTENGAKNWAMWATKPLVTKLTYPRIVQVKVDLAPKMKPYQLIIYELFRRDALIDFGTRNFDTRDIKEANIDATDGGWGLRHPNEGPNLNVCWFQYANLQGPYASRSNFLAPGTESFPKVMDNILGLGIAGVQPKEGRMNKYRLFERRDPLLDDAELTEQVVKRITAVNQKDEKHADEVANNIDFTASTGLQHAMDFVVERKLKRNRLLYYYAYHVLGKGWGAAGFPEMEAFIWEKIELHQDSNRKIPNWGTLYVQLDGVRMPTSAVQGGLRRL